MRMLKDLVEYGGLLVSEPCQMVAFAVNADRSGRSKNRPGRRVPVWDPVHGSEEFFSYRHYPDLRGADAAPARRYR